MTEHERHFHLEAARLYARLEAMTIYVENALDGTINDEGRAQLNRWDTKTLQEQAAKSRALLEETTRENNAKFDALMAAVRPDARAA